MHLISREWIIPIAQNFGRQAGMADNLALHETGLVAMRASVRLLDAAPWHMRFLIGTAEIMASLWGYGFRFYNNKTSAPLAELQVFEKIPLLAAPLLRVYRSLAAMAWFEHPLVLAHFGLNEKADRRQARFRQIRQQTT